MRVVVAPDGFGGVLSAAAVCAAIAEGWRRARPDDDLNLLPLSDGGEGLLDVLSGGGRAERGARPPVSEEGLSGGGRAERGARPPVSEEGLSGGGRAERGARPPVSETELAGGGDQRTEVEVAGPHGHPVHATLLQRPDGIAVIESARACGLALLPPERRSPMPATTYGVGQLIDAARAGGARRIVVGLGGSASVDGGTGALGGLGFRLRVQDGSGLKIGGADLHRVRHVEPAWVADDDDVEVELLRDVDVPLDAAARQFGPQKGATPEQVTQLEHALGVWADVAERDLQAPGARDLPGAGAAGGLGFGLSVGLGASLVDGAARVAELVGLGAALEQADVVVTGEGRLDATSLRGKVIGHLLERASALRVPVRAVVGVAEAAGATALDDVEQASPAGPGDDPHNDTVAAASRLARRARAG